MERVNHRNAASLGGAGTASWEQIVPKVVALDGDRVVYRVAGDGPVLLFVHGMAGSAVTWRHVMVPLARHFTVVAPDLLGHGQSDRPRSEYSLGAHANTLRDLLDVLGYERATVIGQSFGGGVAMQFAYQFPERCERLVLVDSGGLGRDVSVLLRALTLPGAERVLAVACAPATQATFRKVGGWLERAGARLSAAQEEIWRSYASLSRRDARHAFFRTLHDVVDWSGQAVTALHHTAEAVPMLIIWGARDPLIPVKHAFDASAVSPHVRLVILEGIGHYPHCEAPQEFIDAVIDFAASTSPARLPVRSTPRIPPDEAERA